MAYLEELLPEFRKGAKIRRTLWGKDGYVQLRYDGIIDEYGNSVLKNGSICSEWFLKDDWELYEEPIDWDYIIKNGCLCWFWDKWDGCYYIGILDAIYKNCDLKFFMRDKNGNQSQFRNCRPARRDEVTFYEDGKDEKI